jgi:hypothetical protein
MTKHTPGPWIVESVAAYGDTVAVRREGLRSKIAVTHESWICDEHGGTVAANARLIADAPAMLEALEIGLQALRPSAGPDERICAMDILREIIARHKEPNQ